MGLLEVIAEKRELRRVKKTAKNVAKEEMKRYAGLIDQARDEGNFGKLLMYGACNLNIRDAAKKIETSKNPMEIELRKTGLSAMSVAGRIAGKKIGKGGK